MNENPTKVKSLQKTKRAAHNVIALMFLFVPMVLFGQALFSYGNAGVSAVTESIANKQIAERKVNSQDGTLFEEGIISITFDDGWKSVSTNAAPIMGEYRIASTQYVISDSIGQKGYMTVPQLAALQDAGHQIASHSKSHLPLADQTDEVMRSEFEDSKNRLIDYGLFDEGDVMDFAYPYGSRSSRTSEIGSSVYRSLRGATDDLNNGVDATDINLQPTFNKNYGFVGMTIDNTTNIEYIRDGIRYAKEHKGWLVLNFHQIDDENTKFSVSPDNFRAILKIIMDENIKTMTVEDALLTLKEKA